MPAKPAAAVAIFPAVTRPPAEEPAATLKVPGLILTAPGDPKTLNSNALTLSRAWKAATLRVISLRNAVQMQPLYAAQEDGSLTDTRTQMNYRPDDREGFYTSADGDQLLPGYQVTVGLRHYATIFSEGRFREPFLGVFAWTVVFSGLSIVFAAGLGLLLAHAFLLTLCAAVLFPLLIVISVSLRPGNFASGSLIPPAISLEHWRYVLGLPIAGPDGQPLLPDLPVLRWLWNSIQVALASGLVTLLLSTTEELSHESIGEILHLSSKAVERRISRARQHVVQRGRDTVARHRAGLGFSWLGFSWFGVRRLGCRGLLHCRNGLRRRILRGGDLCGFGRDGRGCNS
jgi:ABC-type glycerol-3-phosphate transport system permease component